ncbi:MAG: hypothetical protein F6J97_02710 [Leptolyngbya sp. SIO4C1]|nr:hypothetical protein [Leptolyngbya sp. SIO4C1]
MKLLICPGIHASELTAQFLPPVLARLPLEPEQVWVRPAGYSALCAGELLHFLERQGPPAAIGSLSIVAFSAGVVGAAIASALWQQRGGQLACLVAIDGWGVPLSAAWPVYRLSHDWFTHWSSDWLGSGTASFYAEPSAEHLALWQRPQRVWGWRTESVAATDTSSELRSRVNAADFIAEVLTGANVGANFKKT